MGEAYPELEAHRDFIEKMVRLEEERFGSTLSVGLQKLEETVTAAKLARLGDLIVVSSEDLAKLYDTFGVPFDLMYVGLSGEGCFLSYFSDDPATTGFVEVSTLTEDEFRAGMERQVRGLQQASGIGKTEQKTKTKSIYAAIANRVQSLFRGYETTRVEDAKVLAIISGDKEAQQLNEGDEGKVVLDQTPFYAESG